MVTGYLTLAYQLLSAAFAQVPAPWNFVFFTSVHIEKAFCLAANVVWITQNLAKVHVKFLPLTAKTIGRARRF